MKNLDSEFLEIDQKDFESNESEVKPVTYENDKSMLKNLVEDRDLLEIATTRGYYKFFINIDIEDMNFLRELKEIPALM